MTKSLPALDARLFDFVAALAVPAAALASRDLATPPLRANPAFAARHGAALLGEMEMFRPGAPLRAALMGDYDAVAAAPAAGPDRALAALMPVVGGHGNALRFVLAQLPAEDIASARAALAAVRTLRDEAQDLNADLAAEGLPVLSCEALKGFDARGYLWAHLHAM